jgi:hypothetical protein
MEIEVKAAISLLTSPESIAFAHGSPHTLLLSGVPLHSSIEQTYEYMAPTVPADAMQTLVQALDEAACTNWFKGVRLFWLFWMAPLGVRHRQSIDQLAVGILRPQLRRMGITQGQRQPRPCWTTGVTAITAQPDVARMCSSANTTRPLPQI